MMRGRWMQRIWSGLSGVLGVALAFRLVGSNSDWFWLDEMITLNVAAQPFVETIVATLRLSSHPPLYYLQMHFWMLAGHSDGWILLNSLLWSMAGVASLFVAARWVYSDRVALTAALLFGLLPVSVHFAYEARMYAMLAVFTIWAWYFNHRIVLGPSRVFLLFLMAVFELGIVYGHAAGIYMVFFVGLYGLMLIWRERPGWPRIRPWFITQVIAGLLSLPALASALMRSGPESAPDAMVFLSTLALTVFGPTATTSGALIALAIGIFAVLGVSAVIFERGRLAIVALVILPIVVAVAISVGVKPIIKGRLFVFTAPMIALGLSLTLWSAVEALEVRAGWARRAGAGLAVALGVLFAGLSADYLATYQKPTNYKAAAGAIAEDWKVGDMVYVPRPGATFWGMSWYLIGTDWGSPLRVNNAKPNERWAAVFRRIGPAWLDRLGLNPKTQRVERGGKVIVVGEDSVDQVADAKRIWLVSYYKHEQSSVMPPGFAPSRRDDYRGVIVRLLEKE